MDSNDDLVFSKFNINEAIPHYPTQKISKKLHKTP